ncbi:hypothetical protein ACLOJK_004466 [Asimina triloba]
MEYGVTPHRHSDPQTPGDKRCYDGGMQARTAPILLGPYDPQVIPTENLAAPPL